MAGFLGRMMGNQLTKMMPGMAKMQEAMAKIAVSGSAEGSLG
jgi:DNA-binding protein YbaB